MERLLSGLDPVGQQQQALGDGSNDGGFPVCDEGIACT